MHAESVAGADETAGDMERPLQYAGGSDRATDRSRARDRADTDGDLPVTGWESERELLTTALLGGTDSEAQLEAADLGFTYPDNLIDHLGIDSA